MTDTFTDGIIPGGLRNLSDIKLLICYMLKSSSTPLKSDDIFEIIQESGLANYFSSAQAVDELIKLKNVKTDANNQLVLTDTGENVADTLETSLPISVRERALKATLKLISKIENKKSTSVSIDRGENGYYVHCRIFDGDTVLFDVNMLTPDSLQANIIKENFINNPSEIYGRIIEDIIK